MPAADDADLVLGWDVNKGLDPKYWITAKAKAGKHSPEHLVTVPGKAIARHTIVVAQSGSGKSYFLGRIIEEILIKTSSRVLILDPNSDFRKIALPEAAERWKTAKYDVTERFGFLPDEETVEAFMAEWDKVPKVILSARFKHTEQNLAAKIKRLQIDWTGISTEVLSGELSSILEDELRRCHEFVRAVSLLIARTKPPDWITTKNDLIDVSKRLCDATRGKDGQPIDQAGVIEAIKEEFPVDRPAGPRKRVIEEGLELLYSHAAVHRQFINENIEKFYFSNAYSIRTAGLLRPTNISLATEDSPRLQVIDLPSVEEPRFRPWVISTLLATEWQRARDKWEVALDASADDDTRVPTFIVVDEAHNIVPADPRNHSEKGLLDQFRRIAAEGRKFGLFLILVSQRPDKLDPLVVSECENRAVMKIGSEAVLARTKELLGLDDVPERVLDRCLEFDVGRALLAGAWVDDEPVFLYGAARRTQEGGRNLKAKHWAKRA
jgi:hypothetical protein